MDKNIFRNLCFWDDFFKWYKIPNVGHATWITWPNQKLIEIRFRTEQLLVLSPELTLEGIIFKNLLTWADAMLKTTYVNIYVMPVHFNRPKKIKKKAYISTAKFSGFSVPLCCHVYSPGLFIFQRSLTPLKPVIPAFLAHEQALLKNMLWTALYLVHVAHRQIEQFEVSNLQCNISTFKQA